MIKLRAEHIVTLSKFAEGLNQLLDGQTWVRYQVDGYLPLSVESLSEECVSLCHYGENEGDLMRDPEVVFILHVTEAGTELAFPVYYRNDWAGFEQGNYWDLPERELPPFNSGIIEFCKTWFTNLEEQGYLGGQAELLRREK